MKAINYARLAGLLEGTMTTIPYFVNTPGFKVTDQIAFKNFMKLSENQQGGINMDDIMEEDDSDVEDVIEAVQKKEKKEGTEGEEVEEEEIVEELSIEDLENMYSTEDKLDLVIENEKDTIHGFNVQEGIINNKFQDYKNDIVKNETKVEDEYNIKKIDNKTIIISKYAGAGKSETIKRFLIANNLKGLFVINNNNLAIEIKKEDLDENGKKRGNWDAITPYVLMGCNICVEENEKETAKKFNIKDYDVIIYEEVF